MHEPARELAVRRQQRETRRVAIERAHVDPAPIARPRQIERRFALRRTARRAGLVVREKVVVRRAGQLRGGQPHRLTVEADALAPPQLLAELRYAAVHGDAALGHPALDRAPRANTRIRENLVDALRHGRRTRGATARPRLRAAG